MPDATIPAVNTEIITKYNSDSGIRPMRPESDDHAADAWLSHLVTPGPEDGNSVWHGRAVDGGESTGPGSSSWMHEATDVCPTRGGIQRALVDLEVARDGC